MRDARPRLPRPLSIPLLLGLACPALAQGPTSPPQEPTAQEAKPTKARRCVLRLRGGSTLRALARQTGERWSYKEKGKWIELPQGAVESSHLERELLAEFKQRHKDTREDPAAFAALAGWALDHGLTEEGVTAFDLALQEHPREAAVLAELAAHSDHLRRPRLEPGAAHDTEKVAELKRWALERGATARELAAIELAKVGARSELIAELSAELSGGTVRQRTLAAHLLRRVGPATVAKPLILHAVLDSSDAVRREASLALGAIADASVAAPIVRALGGSDVRVRTQAAQALGHMAYPAAAPAVMARMKAAHGTLASGHSVPHNYIFIGRQFAYLQDFDVEVAFAQAAADPAVNTLVEGQVLDVGVRGVERRDYVLAERRTLASAMRQITGENPGRRAQDWIRWWDANGQEWLDQRGLVPRERSGTGE